MQHINIIGVGRWGPNILRNFCSMEDVQVGIVCDLNEENLARINSRFPEIECTTDTQRAITTDPADAIVICTPVASHFELASQALAAGRHVFVEKPLAASSDECRQLIKLAAKKKKYIFTGHTFKYNAGIRAVKDYIASGELGEIYLIDANRTNLGPVRYDVNAMWDLAAHDISIFSYWLDTQPHAVSAHGGCYLNPNIEDVVYATFEYGSGTIAHVHASWLNPRKIREITVVGEKKMLIWNDMNLSEPIRIYNRGFQRDDEYNDSFASFRLAIREGDVVIPSVRLNEPLRFECEQFIECLKNGSPPLTDGVDGLQVVLALEAASQSMLENNRRITIHQEADTP